MKHVVLIGFMGSGKSTISYKLSYILKRCYIDTDKLIEETNKMTISEMFEKFGEEYFRNKENKCLKAIRDEKGERIISVGGGTPLRSENREVLKQMGTVVYLRATADTLYKRLKYDKNRPLLQVEDRYGLIKGLLEQRNPIYEECADIIIDIDNKEAEQIMNEIIARL